MIERPIGLKAPAQYSPLKNMFPTLTVICRPGPRRQWKGLNFWCLRIVKRQVLALHVNVLLFDGLGLLRGLGFQFTTWPPARSFVTFVLRA